MNVAQTSQTQRSSFFYSGIVLLLAFIVAMGTVILMEKTDIGRTRERTEQQALIMADKIRYVVENLLLTTNTVEALIKEGDGQIQNFDWIIPIVIKDYPIHNIAVAPKGIVTQIYPYEGNEAAIGHNLLTDPARATEAKITRDSKKLTISGPYDLKQGIFGAIGRLPIFLTDDKNREYFWGFVCVTLEFPQALAAARIETLETQGYAYELWRFHPDSKDKQIFLSSAKKIDTIPVNSQVIVPNSIWTLSLAPEHGWIDNGRLVFRTFLALVFSLLAAFLFKNVLELTRKRSELDISIRQQSDNYKRLNELNEELRRFRHDIKNHMLSLTNLLNHQDIIKAQEYIASISALIDPSSQIVNTENYVFDALISQKIAEARSKQILVENEIFIDRQLKISNTDWSILFGNALDNAIEACEQVTSQTPKIQILIRYHGNMLQTRISNTADRQPMAGSQFYKTTKSEEGSHGLGLSNIHSAVKRYHGVLETQYENGIFSLTFLLFDI